MFHSWSCANEIKHFYKIQLILKNSEDAIIQFKSFEISSDRLDVGFIEGKLLWNLISSRINI